MNKNQNQFEVMTKTPVRKLVISLSIPTILSMMVSTIYNMVDTYFVSTLGNSASGAVGIVFGFMTIAQAFGFMMGQGGGSLMSRRLGAREGKLADETASTAFFASLTAGLLLGVFGLIFIDPMIMMLGSTDTILPYARTYLYYILAACPMVVSSFTLNNLLRYEGKARLGMIGLLAGGVLNIGGDAIFMFGMHMGIAGAGLSTAISQTISFALLLGMFLTGRTQTKLTISNINLSLLGDISVTGLPALLRQGLNSVSTIIMNQQAAFYAGDAGVAALSIVARVSFFLFAIALGIGQGFQPVCAFNYGARKYSRVRQGYRVTVVLGTAVLFVLTIISMFFSGEIVSWFRNDPTVIEIGTRALRLLCIAQLLMPLCMVTEMLMQGTGNKKEAIALSALRGGLILIPLMLILPYFRGIYGVEEAQPLAFLLSIPPAVCLAIRFFRNLPTEEE